VDYIITPVVSQELPLFTLVAGGQKAIDLAKLLRARSFFPLKNSLFFPIFPSFFFILLHFISPSYFLFSLFLLFFSNFLFQIDLTHGQWRTTTKRYFGEHHQSVWGLLGVQGDGEGPRGLGRGYHSWSRERFVIMMT
jgi:hypothetical protein